MDSDFGNAVINTSQSRNRLEDRRSKNDEVPREMQKTVEANTGKVGMAEAEIGRNKRRSRKEMRRERKEKKQKKEKTVEVKKVVEEWESWDEEEEAARSEEEAKKLVPNKFYQ